MTLDAWVIDQLKQIEQEKQREGNRTELQIPIYEEEPEEEKKDKEQNGEINFKL